MIIALFLGATFGFIAAVPVAGPVSAAIFGRGMRGKYSQGRWLALGAGIVEGGYTLLAFWSFNHFLADLSSIFVISKIVSAVILAVLGLYFFRSKKLRHPVVPTAHVAAHDQKAFWLGAGMSLINLTLVASWTAAITTLFSMKLFPFSTPNIVMFSIGVTLGIVAWFSVMMRMMATHRHRMDPATLDKFLKLMGSGLLLLAMWMVVRIFL